MIQGSNLELALFSDVPEQDTLETLYNLNQENTPEVGSLSSVNELRSLIQLSALNFFVLNEEEIRSGKDAVSNPRSPSLDNLRASL